MRELVACFVEIADWKIFLERHTKELLLYNKLMEQGHQDDVRRHEAHVLNGTKLLVAERAKYEELLKVCPMGHEYFEDSGEVYEIRDRVVTRLQTKKLYPNRG